MAGVHRVPVAAEIDLEPGAEIHRRRVRRHADIAEIAGAVARRDVHAAAKRDREMGEVAADAGPVGVAAMRGAQQVGVHVVEADMAVDEIEDRLDARPAGRRCPKKVSQAKSAKPVGVAIAAAEQEDQHVVGQVLDLVLHGFKGTTSGWPLS